MIENSGRYWRSIIGFSLFCCLWLCSLWLLSTMNQVPHAALADSNLEEIAESLLVGIPLGTTSGEAQTILQDANLGELIVEKVWPEFGIALIKIPEQSASPIMAASTDAMQLIDVYRLALDEIPVVNYVEYNSVISIAATHSNMDEYPSNINLSPGRIPSNATNDQDEVVVALIDTGFNTDEIDLDSHSLWENQAEIDGIVGIDDDGNGFIDDFHGWDWIDNDNVVEDLSGHGTSTGKAILDLVEQAHLDGNRVKLMPLRILREDGKGEISDLVDALAYALRSGAQIANLNLVSYYNSPPLSAATKMAYEEGLLLIAPSVYQCRSHGFWPASYHEALGVTYLIDAEVRGMICPIRYEADLVIVIELEDISYTNLQPRSLPAPYTSGFAALILLDNPDMSNMDVKTEILNLADYSVEGFLSGVPVLDIQQQIEEQITPTALLETIEPTEHKHYLPFIIK